MNINSKIRPSDRVSAVKEYYFSRKLKEVAALRASGRDIISLGIGGPDRMPAGEVVETLCAEAHCSDAHSYQSYVGLPQLREAFARWYRHYYGVCLDANSEILPLIGSKEGILHVSMAFLNPGDGVLVPDPGYPTYSSVSHLVQAKVFTYDLTEENDWLPDFDALERLPLDDIKLMWVNYPSMPTGRVASLETFARLVDFGRRHGIVIAHDNPYSFILNDAPVSMLSVPGAKDIVVELNSLSKSHNMAGWRIGMLASNSQFVEWILKVKSNIDSGQFKPMMLAAVKALAVSGDWYRELNEEYSVRRRIAERIMTRLRCRYDSAQRGLFLWGKVPDAVDDVERFCNALLYEAGVFVTPGFIFGHNGARYIRISLCADVNALNEAYRRVDLFMQSHI